MTTEEGGGAGQDGGQHEPADKLRRFALGVALILIVFVVAGGKLKQELQGPGIGLVEFARPGVLLILLSLVSVYATWRYTYYVIIVPVTKNKIRRMLWSDNWSLLCVYMTEDAYRTTLGRSVPALRNEHTRLERRCLPRLTPWQFIVFTDQAETTADFIKHICANRVDQYFPGISGQEITLEKDRKDGDFIRAKVGPLEFTTIRRIILERCDTSLPVAANVLALFLLLAWWQWGK